MILTKSLNAEPDRRKLSLANSLFYTILAFICVKMESYWQSNPVRKVRKCLTFLEKSAEEEEEISWF